MEIKYFSKFDIFSSQLYGRFENNFSTAKQIKNNNNTWAVLHITFFQKKI